VPSIESESVSSVTSTDATLEAQVNLHEAGAGAYYQFQLVRNPSAYASEILCPTKLPPGTSGCIGTQSASALPIGFIPGNTMQPSVDHLVNLDLAGAGVTLQPGTTYHYRLLVARRVQTEDTIEWEPPTVYGPDQTFATPSGSPPAIESESVSRLTPTDATLEAQIDTEGFETTYNFYLQEAPLCLDFGCEIPEYEPFALPTGKLLGSFVAQSVSVDLNSTGVTLNPSADYRYWVTATSPAGTTRGQTQRFIAAGNGAQPLNTTTPPGSHSTTGPAQNAEQGTVTPSATDSADNNGTPSPKVTVLTSAKKLAKAVKACKRKPKKQRASCRKQAHMKYGTTATKSKKR
jgi:hypothetical protein